MMTTRKRIISNKGHEEYDVTNKEWENLFHKMDALKDRFDDTHLELQEMTYDPETCEVRYNWETIAEWKGEAIR